MRKLFSIPIVLIFLFSPLFIKAEQFLGDSVNFYIESTYDVSDREQVQATLKRVSPRAYWYLDDVWWDEREGGDQKEITEALDSLIEEFETQIYPILTKNFGSEWNPGIDKDSRITVLVHPMTEEVGGYFNSADEYPTSQISRSNEREMIYLNADYLTAALAKSFLAHEFQHLISFNQKERIYNISEDVWLNEARSEYGATLLGYNDDFEGSNLQRRIRNFLEKPYDSLTEWKNISYDYGVVNLFTHYLVDHYGKGILVNSLKDPKAGIDSLNSALHRAGFKEDFSQIFTDWTIAVLVNDCSISVKYCYLSPSLKDFKVTPLINYLPSIGRSILSVANTTKGWAGNWHKFIGGNGVLKLEFAGFPEANFTVPYLLQDGQGGFTIEFLELDEDQQGILYISDFGSENISLTIIPSVQNKIFGFSDLEPSVSFSWSASSVKEAGDEEEELIENLLAQIERLRMEIAKVQSQINDILSNQGSCQNFGENLYYGIQDKNKVKCLQKFLKSQGPKIYPEGLITGNFLFLTKQAVIRFQEKYSDEILTPLGLEKGTGFMGLMTRNKINQLLVQ